MDNRSPREVTRQSSASDQQGRKYDRNLTAIPESEEPNPLQSINGQMDISSGEDEESENHENEVEKYKTSPGITEPEVHSLSLENVTETSHNMQVDGKGIEIGKTPTSQFEVTRVRNPIENNRDTGKSADAGFPDVFPFQRTPSGNFKISKDRVAFSNDHITIFAKGSANELEEGSSKEFKDKNTQNPMQRSQSSPEKSKISPNDDVYPSSSAYQESIPLESGEKSSGPPKVPRDEYPTCYSDSLDFNECLQYRLRRAIHPDTKVVIGSQEFPCHGILLQAYSKYFDSIKRPSDMIHRIHLPEGTINAEDFPTLMDWILLENEACKQRVVRKNNVCLLYSAAVKLDIPGLKEHCMRFINDKLDKPGDPTILQLYEDCGKLKHCRDLQKKLALKFSSIFPVLYKRGQFLSMGVDEFVILVDSDDVKIQSELEIYDASSRWLLYDWGNRHQFAVRVMKCVRFGFLSPLQLTQIRHCAEATHLQDYSRIYSFPEIKDALQDGLTYAILKDNYKNRPEELRNWIQLSKVHEPRPRTYLEPSCNHSNDILNGRIDNSSHHQNSSSFSPTCVKKHHQKHYNYKTRNTNSNNTVNINSNLKKPSEKINDRRYNKSVLHDSNSSPRRNTSASSNVSVSFKDDGGDDKENDITLPTEEKTPLSQTLGSPSSPKSPTGHFSGQHHVKKRNSKLEHPFTMSSVLKLKSDRVRERVSWRT